MQTKKTLKELKELLPGLVHKVRDGYHYVGDRNVKKGFFLIKGSGSTELEAWTDAYEWQTKTGQYCNN